MEEKDDTIYLFTDGSTKGNGTKDAMCGYGVFVPKNRPQNTFGMVPYWRQTSATAELWGLLSAVAMVEPKKESPSVVICCDHITTVNTFNKFLYDWKGDPESMLKKKNIDLILTIDKLLQFRPNVIIKHVKGHKKASEDLSEADTFIRQSNDCADDLAKAGKRLYEISKPQELKMEKPTLKRKVYLDDDMSKIIRDGMSKKIRVPSKAEVTKQFEMEDIP